MPASSELFGQRNAPAVLKHGVLTRYAQYFAGRAGSATQGRVAFIDGYAGEGRYQDGSPGSPLLLASQATRAQMFGRDVKLAFVEQDAARREQLTQSLAENDIEPDQLLGGGLASAANRTRPLSKCELSVRFSAVSTHTSRARPPGGSNCERTRRTSAAWTHSSG